MKNLARIFYKLKIYKEYKNILNILSGSEHFLSYHEKKEKLHQYFQQKNLSNYFSEKQKNHLLSEAIKYKFSILEIFFKNHFSIDEKNFYLLLNATKNNREENVFYIFQKNKDIKIKNPNLFQEVMIHAVIDSIYWYNYDLFTLFMENGAKFTLTNTTLNYLMQSDSISAKKIITDIIYKYKYEFTQENKDWLNKNYTNTVINKNNQYCLQLLEKRDIFHQLVDHLQINENMQEKLIKI